MNMNIFTVEEKAFMKRLSIFSTFDKKKLLNELNNIKCDDELSEEFISTLIKKVDAIKEDTIVL